ncbi:MAG: arginine--tRNA ligase [Candidatus Omnitrophica bacterium]|nr:arginine--tRNA ligase [Candidatus Omnitrophota bacterium]
MPSKIEKYLQNLLKETVTEFLEGKSAEVSGLCDEQGILSSPKENEHGDLATPIALKISSRLKSNPMKLAESLVRKMTETVSPEFSEFIKKVEVKKPGFINFFLTPQALYGILPEITIDYGRQNAGRGESVNIEFVSANPTGPLSVAHGRQAAVGDTLARILEFCGYKVTREYYINDIGNQITMLGKSLQARYLQELGENSELPADGYKGEYLITMAKEIVNESGGKYRETAPEDFFSRYAAGAILRQIKEELLDFGVEFNIWFSQEDFTKAGKVEEALRALEEKGYVYQQDGARWFKSTSWGDDKDRVVIKSNGDYTYLAPDIAYHKDKYNRGFKMLVNLWGPDHHGYIPRLKAAVQSLGYADDSLKVIIIQLATLYRDGKPVKMSTRAGEYVTLREVIEEVGKDAARFFFLMRKANSHLDFDLELAKKETPENPVYYVQYAHARISSILEYEKSTGGNTDSNCDYTLLKEEEELGLLKALRKFPEVVLSCANDLEPYGITLYLRELATSFHSFYTKHRVVTDDIPLTKARLSLVSAVRTVLATGLNLLGIAAPEKM